jgi:hypothetical protein
MAYAVYIEGWIWPGQYI